MSFIYNISVTGDCQNTSSGSTYITSTGGTPPYIITYTSPGLGSYSLPDTRTGLTYGTYNFQIVDNGLPPVTATGQFYISSGVCTTGLSVQDTTCNLNNGSITAYTQTSCTNSTYNIYNVDMSFSSSTTSSVGFQIWNNLSPGAYYVDIIDCGGCSARTQTCVVNTSTEVDFGLYVVDNPNCSGPMGKIFITGLTGNPPYTYLWSTGQVTDSITGLTSGLYGVTVTDSTNCSVTKSITVNDVDVIGVGGFTSTPPSCFSSDGTVTITITGGTGPYYYSGSNGTTVISFNQSYTFTGLGVGSFSVLVTDAAFCSTTDSTTLSIPNSIGSVTLSTTNSLCSYNNGTITVNITGTNFPYTYSIIDSLGNLTTVTTNTTTYTFTSLETGTYTVLVDNSGSCLFSDVVTINNTNSFEITGITNNTTCGNNNGNVTFNVNVFDTYNYQIPSLGLQSFPVTQTGYTFNNLPSGSYTALITNSTGCSRTYDFVIGQSSNVNFILNKTNCFNGSDGTLTTLISSGQPPFTITWSNNITGQTGIYVTGLTAGTYSVIVTDNNGCIRTRSIDITCDESYVSYEIFKFCEGVFIEGKASKLGLQQMLNEGYKDITEGETGCELVNADFIINVQVGTGTTSENFYTTNSLLDYPTDDLYITTLNGILTGFTGIGLVEISEESNSIKLNTDCEYTLQDKNVKIDVQIVYNVLCLGT